MAQPFTITVKNFEGGEVNSADPEVLRDNQLQKAENVRFSLSGGFKPRPGYKEVSFTTFSGSGSHQGALGTKDGVYFVNNGKIYYALSDLSDAFEIGSGLDTTAKCQLFEYNEDIYITNGVDRPRRLAKTYTASTLIVTTSTSLDVKNGQGWKFTSTGTVVVVSSLGVDSITVTAKTNDTLTITDTTVGLATPSGSLIFQISTLSNVPIGKINAVFKNTWFIGGLQSASSSENYNENVFAYGRGATGTHPEYFYDFTGLGASYEPVGEGGKLTAFKSTKIYLLLVKEDQVYYLQDIDTTTYKPIMGLITDQYGAAGENCVELVHDQAVIFTGKALKRIGEQQGLNNTVPSPDASFDVGFSQYFKNELAEDQSDAILHYNPYDELIKLWVTKKNGTIECVVVDNKMNPVTLQQRNCWSRDTNKIAGVAFIYNKKTYWCSNSEAKIYQDEFGYTDNGLSIISTIRTKEFDLDLPRLGKYFKTLFIKGTIYENSEETINIYFDNILTMSYSINGDDFVSSGSSGSIGYITIGEGAVGGGVENESIQGVEFEDEKLLLKRKDSGKISIEYIIDGEAQIVENKSIEITGYASDKFIKKIRS